MARFRTVSIAASMATCLLWTSCRSVSPPASKGHDLTATELFDLRTKCSELARKFEAEAKREKSSDRLTAGDIDSFTNRYDPEANRCYVERFTMHYQKANNGEAQTMQYRAVVDAQENAGIVSCNDYVHPSGPRQTNCTDKNAKGIPVNEANSQMNKLMGESVDWP